MKYDDKDWFETLPGNDATATMTRTPGGDDLLAVCSSCSATVDLKDTCQRIVDGGVKIVCTPCLTGAADAAAETPVVDELDSTRARGRNDDTAIPIYTDEDETSPAPPRFVPRARHLAVAGIVAAVVVAIVMFAPGATAPAARAPASLTAPMHTAEIKPEDTAPAEQPEDNGVTGELSEREKAIAYRDAIRERKRERELRRKESSERKALKGRFGRYSLGVLPTALRGENWTYPLPGVPKHKSTAFGRFNAPRRGHRWYRPSCRRGHCGYDLKGPYNMPVVAVLDGVVERVVWRSRRPSGRYVIIKHPDGLRTWYMHLHRPRHGLRAGMAVRAGEEIGRLGTTGLIQKVPHLHFSLEKAGEFYVDPEPFLMASHTIAKPLPPAVATNHRM